ncbi:MAG: DUF4845 domain-containing protein [Arenicella sp.]
MKNNNKFSYSSYHHQKGLTVWSFLFVGGVVIFCMYIGALLVPVYTADGAIKDALESSVEKVSRSNIRKKDIIKEIDKRLYIDGVYDIPDLKEAVQVKKLRSGTTVSVDYKKEIPLFYNIGMYLDFKHVIEK